MKPSVYKSTKHGRCKGPLEVRLYALRRGEGSKIGRNVTQPMLARLLKCTVQNYQRMESGRQQFKDKHLEKLADYYGVDYGELCQLRLQERLLYMAGFPSEDAYSVLTAALGYAEAMPIFTAKNHW